MYEDRQEFIWRIPSLCSECQTMRSDLLQILQQYQAAWNARREQLASDGAFLKKWRTTLREIETYGRKGANPSLVTMINKLLAQLP